MGLNLLTYLACDRRTCSTWRDRECIRPKYDGTSFKADIDINNYII